jgi:SAM-dependent methyltransferase
LSTADSVLEVGCGAGKVLAMVRASLRARLSVGIDYGVTQAGMAGERTEILALSGDALHLPFRSKSFALVYLVDVLEHVLNPGAVVREIGRVGRQVALLVPAERGILSDGLYAVRRLRGKPTNLQQYGHIWRWTPRQIVRLAREAGLSVLGVNMVAHHPGDTPGTTWGRAVRTAHSNLSRVDPRIGRALFGGTAVAVLASSVAAG